MDSYHFEFLPLEGKVDKKEGIIRDVSVITSGVQARGHKLQTGESLHTDMTTLEQMKSCADEMVQVPVKWNHRTGADAVNGYLTNFRIKGQKLKADWVLLKEHERYKHALELAEKMPKGVGLSASFRGKSEIRGRQAFARCTELPSVDLVATPAANPDGLFERGDFMQQKNPSQWVDTPGGGMSEKNNAPDTGRKEIELGDVLEAVLALGERISPLEEFHSHVTEAIEAEETAFAQQEEAESIQLEQGEDPVAYLERRLAEAEQARNDEASRIEFEELEEKVGRILEVNTQLAAENAAMAEALVELSDGKAAFSTPGDDGSVSVIVPRTGEGKPLTEFEQRCKELEAGDKSPTEAIQFAVEEDPDRYHRHLSEKGAVVE